MILGPAATLDTCGRLICTQFCVFVILADDTKKEGEKSQVFLFFFSFFGQLIIAHYPAEIPHPASHAEDVL